MRPEDIEEVEKNIKLWGAIEKVNTRYRNFNFNSIEMESFIHYDKKTSASKMPSLYRLISGVATFNFDNFLVDQILCNMSTYKDIIDKYKPLYDIYQDYLDEIKSEFEKHRAYGEFIPPETVGRSSLARLFVSDERYIDKAWRRFDLKAKYEEKVFHEKMYAPKFPSVSLYLYAQSPWGYKDYSTKYDFITIIKSYEMASDKAGKRTFIQVQRSLVSDSVRYDVLRRDGFKCKICGATAKDGVKLEVDHIIPVSKGGRTTMDNLQTLCERCNRGKRNKI